ncbi:DNA-3-methyladenine glycosylase [Falsirhodobacter sp. alg1]|uniref:DNA-3-methyladenine glycosylase family protein n=1 Tax=Falsirhodobacter sp. alg1 TaxID=1472418 RepID=UPI00192D1271|nr:DNA-3-methyladenine glycosylase 2 family protein [Falsirhodobacter sp. alg1]
MDPRFAETVTRIGFPPPHGIERGQSALLRIILGQQVSVASAQAVFLRLQAARGDLDNPSSILQADDQTLRETGFSRQKISHARSLAEAIASGALPLNHLPASDEEAISALMAVKGIGRWTAEIYLLMAEGRADIWPAGDLAVRIGISRILQMNDPRPPEALLRLMAKEWRPHRSTAALLAWHLYLTAPI